MLISICALIIALAIEFMPFALSFNPLFLSILMVASGSLILLGALYLNTSVLTPLSKLEQKLIPNLMELLRHNRLLYLGRLFLYLFPLLFFIAGAVFTQLDATYQHHVFLGWIVLLGISLDLLRDSWRHFVNFLNPSFLVQQLSNEAKKSVTEDDDQLLWNNLDRLAEIALRSVEKSKLALSTQALQTFPPIMHAFFASTKSISRLNKDTDVEKSTGRDEASYTVFYLLQRLELINDKALHYRLETVCRQMIMILGKIIVYAAKLDLSMASFPTHFLSKFGLKAQQHHFDEVGVLTTSTLLEISKTILTDIDITYAELQDPFQAIINGLDALAKGAFKRDKTSNIKVLIQPLLDLKGFFQTEKMVHHRDTPVIIQEIDRAIDEFTVLEQVMRSIPSVQEMAGTNQSGAGESPFPTV